MKKLLIISLLVTVFAVGTVYAQRYEVSSADTKAFMIETNLALGGQVCFDIYLKGISLPQTAGGAWIDFTDSIAVLSYVSSGRAFFDGSEGVYGPWDPFAMTIIPPPLPPGNIMMAVANLAGAVPDGDGDLIVGRVCLQCEGPGDGYVNITTIPAVSTWTPADDSTINGNTTQPVLTIHQAYECTTDEDCQDGLWCNGIEICVTYQCLPATTIPCDDGDRCTLDCDEDTNSCLTDVCDISELSCYTDPCVAFWPCLESGCIQHCDADCDLLSDASDNCPNTPNALIMGTCTRGNIGLPCDPWSGDAQCDTEMGAGDGFCSSDQEDTYPPGGNGIGDACECEGDFNCDGNVDASDVTLFLGDFGRSPFNKPCSNANPCDGDFLCDWDVDAFDVNKFLEDFGRNQFNNPCPACEVGDWCVY